MTWRTGFLDNAPCPLWLLGCNGFTTVPLASRKQAKANTQGQAAHERSPSARPDRLVCACGATGQRCHRPIYLQTGYCGMCTANSCTCSCTSCDPHTSDSEQDRKAKAADVAAVPSVAPKRYFSA